LARFYTTSDFDCEYLQNETIYPKSERYVIENDSSRVPRNTSSDLWSNIHKAVHVRLDPPKSIFSRNYISSSRGCCWPLKFLHTLDTGQGLLAHNKPGRGSPRNFKGENLKLGLKFHTGMPVTLGVVGVTSRNFTRGCGSLPG